MATFSIHEFIIVFKKNLKFILFSTLIALIVSIIVAFFILKPVYLSSGTVKAAAKTSGLSGLLGGGFADLGDFGDLASGTSGASKELALYQDILYSRRVAVESITRFNLNDEWKFRFTDEAVKNFRDNILEVTQNKQAGTLTISIYDENPQRAKDIVDFLIVDLNNINIELNVQNAKNNRVFIEERYNLGRLELKQAEDSLKVFQDVYGVAPDIIIKAAVQSQVQLETEIKSEEVKLDILRKILSPGEAEIKAQEEKIAALKLQLLNIQNSNVKDGSLNLKGSPELVLDFMRLQRNVEIQTKVLAFLLPIYEQSKIEENKETPTVLILDQPFVPEKKAKPKRLPIVLVFTGFVFCICFFYKLIVYKFKNGK